MSDQALLDRFERLACKLLLRDGTQTFMPSTELQLGDLDMMVGVNASFHKDIGWMTCWSLVAIAYKDKQIYLRRKCNGEIREEVTDLEGVKMALPLIEAQLPLERLADV